MVIPPLDHRAPGRGDASCASLRSAIELGVTDMRRQVRSYRYGSLSSASAGPAPARNRYEAEDHSHKKATHRNAAYWGGIAGPTYVFAPDLGTVSVRCRQAPT